MRSLTFAVVLVALVVGARAVIAADWGGVIPGESTKDTVRARHGDPTRTTNQKIDRFDTVQWVYEGDRAPTGMSRMTIDFGLAAPTGFRADVVRSFKLEPHPRSEEHTSELQSRGHLVCRLLLEKKKKKI